MCILRGVARTSLRGAARRARYVAQQQLERVRPQRDRDEIHRYWERPDAADAGNQPSAYVDPDGGTARSEFLLSLAGPYLSEGSRVLEVGTNVGRNLNQLWQAGQRNLTGIEISEQAVEAMRREYPEMAAGSDIRIGRAEEVLPALEEPFDLVFTMAVLVHIHFDSDPIVFPNLARLAGRALITVEDERHRSWRHFTRDYREVFEPLGLRQVRELECGPLGIGLPSDYVARVFERSPERRRQLSAGAAATAPLPRPGPLAEACRRERA